MKHQGDGQIGLGRESITAAITTATATFTTTTTVAATRTSAVGAAETTAAAFATTVAAAAFATTTTVATAAAFATTTTVATAAAFTTAAVATTTFAAAAVATTTTTEAAATCTGRTCFHRAGFVDHHIAAAQWLTIHAVDGSLRFIIAAHFHKAEAFGAASVTFHHDFGAGHSTEFTERLFQIAVANRVRQVADVKFVAHERDSSKYRDKSDVALKTHSTNLKTSEGKRN